MAKGRLNITEKYAIQGMLHDRKTTEEIADSLGRTVKTVQKYVDGELSDIQDTVVDAQIAQEENKEKVIKNDDGLIVKSRIKNKGEAIMHEGLSAKGDEIRKQITKGYSRSMKGNVYNIDEKTIVK